jgi:hypothetical protein
MLSGKLDKLSKVSVKFYIHVTVHRNKFLFNNQSDAQIIQLYSVIKLYMFREHRDSAWKRSSETCIKLTSAECTVESS